VDVTMLLGKGDGTFAVGKTFAVSSGGILSGDFNGDLKPDLAVHAADGISVLLGRGDGTFVAQLAQNAQLSGGDRLTDFNGDHKLDLIDFFYGVLLGNGDGTFQSPIPLPSSCRSGRATLGDFNNDKKPDIAFIPVSGKGVGVCLGNGDGTFKNAVVYDSNVQHKMVLTGDFNHDGKLDLAVSDVGGISILLGNGDGTFQSAIPTAARGFEPFTASDFNHDGNLDIAILGGDVEVLLGKGDGTFRAPVFSSNSKGGFFGLAGDLNNDRNPDLVTSSTDNSGVYVLLGNGDGTFKAPTFQAISNVSTFLLRDVNGDGKLDLIAPEGLGFLAVLLGNGDGTFQPTKTFVGIYSQFTSLAAGDINGDGLLDVASINPGTNRPGTLIVYLNRGH
jgi:hypothetical protein